MLPGHPVGAHGQLLPRPMPAVVHCQALTADHVKVLVDSVVRERVGYVVPFPPEEDITTLGACKGNFLIWPRRLVTTGTQPFVSPSQTPRPSPPGMPKVRPRSMGDDRRPDINPSPPFERARYQSPQQVMPPCSLMGAIESAHGKIDQLYKEEETREHLRKLEGRKGKRRGLGRSKDNKESSSKDKGSTAVDNPPLPAMRGNWERRPDLSNMSKLPNYGGKLPDESYLVDRRGDEFLIFYPGRPMLREDQLPMLPREMLEFHSYYMRTSAPSAQHAQQIDILVPADYAFFNFETMRMQRKEESLEFSVDFIDIFFMFNRGKLDNNMLRLWCLFYTREARRKQQKDVAVLDPLMFSAAFIGDTDELRQSTEVTQRYLEDALVHYKDRSFVLFFYQAA